MLISRLTLQIARASRLAECFLPRLAAPLLTLRPAVLPSYSTLHSSKTGPASQPFLTLEPELEDLLVPRKMSITPLESWLTVKYSLLENEEAVGGGPEQLRYEPASPYELPSAFQSPEEGTEEEDGAGELSRAGIECKKIMKIRRRKMNKHQYKKRMKRNRFLHRKIRITRMRKKQKRFEHELLQYAKRFGLSKLPEGWVTPKLYFGDRNSK
uniref:Small ribosomal subunit protein mS38 n=1 Tax=Pogona vitticeps TaxID=103695 RepID=A0ABM5EKP6_9SAUR